jgi:hypothetical protein
MQRLCGFVLSPFNEGGCPMTMTRCTQFDFERGCLHESPCKSCKNRDLFPACMKGCKPLGLVQQRLARVVSCNYALSEKDTFALALPDRSL